MAQRVTFNQEVKHGLNHYKEGDSVTVEDEEAEYFGSHGWLEGIAASKDPLPPPGVDLPPTGGIVPGPAYDNDAPFDVKLDVHDSIISAEDTLNG